MPFVATLLAHPSGLPHADTLGLPVWAQWLVIGAVGALGVWLALDGREARPGEGGGGGGGRVDPFARDTHDLAPGESLVAGRAARPRPAPPPPIDDSFPDVDVGPVPAWGATAEAPLHGEQGPAAVARIEIAPGARLRLPARGGQAFYIESGAPDLENARGVLRVYRANVPHLATPAPPEVGPGRMVRLAAGDLAVASDRARVIARNTTDRMAAVLLLGTRVTGPPAWLNPFRLLTLLLALLAGWFALDRARAVQALANVISTDGGLNVSRVAFAFAALLIAGGLVVPSAPRFAALLFLGAAGAGTFLATAERWEERLAWWGAAYVLTAWERLPLWAIGAAALALPALVGWGYRARRPLRLPRHRRVRQPAARGARPS